MGSLVHLEDLKLASLLEDAAHLAEVQKLVQPPQEGARPCEKDVKRKLEFRSSKACGGSLPQVGKMFNRGGQKAGRWRQSSTQLNRSLLDQENLNNNSKRSFPNDFECSVVFEILSKVKPSYTSCAVCMYPAGGAPEASTERHENPSAPSHLHPASLPAPCHIFLNDLLEQEVPSSKEAVF
ncbi:hypothetical protein LEMLEM_LOCUS17315 [Lemmus lemmus]